MCKVDELTELLRPSWGSEQWILEGWQRISQEEKELVKSRLTELFQDGLPFALEHEKTLYIYAFSLLAQLEVLAIQVPLKFESRMTDPKHRQLMHAQLLDEIFHGLVFTKIVYQLSAPYALPPAYSKNIEVLCNFIRAEECPKIAVVLLNLIAEGWIEEIFTSFERRGIAPKVFATIVADEHRHVCEADLYRVIGLPDKQIVQSKIKYLEKQLLTNVFLQYKYMLSITAILGGEGVIDFLKALDKKHNEQLHKLSLKPSLNWQFLMRAAEKLFPRVLKYSQSVYEIEMTPIRQALMSQWDDPKDPTMVGEFNLNVSCLDFFNKKYPPDTLTILILQSISLSLHENDHWRSYISQMKLLQTQESYVGLAVKLPDCGDHIGTIVFENCHELTVQDLAVRVRNSIQMMVYCFKKRQQIDKEHPHLMAMTDDALYDFLNDLYDYPMINNSVVTVSNIGSWGYTQGKSPLRPNETVKITLFAVEKRQVWNKEKQTFEPQDLLPISLSADHRIFDGNIAMPQMFPRYFQQTFTKMLDTLSLPVTIVQNRNAQFFVKLLEQLLAINLELGYKALAVLQTYWPDFLALEETLNFMAWIKKEVPV